MGGAAASMASAARKVKSAEESFGVLAFVLLKTRPKSNRHTKSCSKSVTLLQLVLSVAQRASSNDSGISPFFGLSLFGGMNLQARGPTRRPITL